MALYNKSRTVHCVVVINLHSNYGYFGKLNGWLTSSQHTANAEQWVRTSERVCELGLVTRLSSPRHCG